MSITKEQLLDTVKQLKKYTDNKSVSISSASGNAIQQKPDGLYVPQRTEVNNDILNNLTETSDGVLLYKNKYVNQ